VCEYYNIEKQILYDFNAAASSCRRASFLQLLKSFVLFPADPYLYSEIPY